MRIMSTSKTVPLAVSYLHFNCFLKLVIELTNLSSLGKEFHNLQDLIKKTLLKMFCTRSWYNEVVMAPAAMVRFGSKFHKSLNLPFRHPCMNSKSLISCQYVSGKRFVRDKRSLYETERLGMPSI